MMKLKKYINTAIQLLILVTAINCSSDNDSSESNLAPEAFDLLTVVNNETNVDVLPTFTWNASIDPDGDAVTYEILIGTSSNPTTVLASNLSQTNFQVLNRLSLFETYFWKVIAKDTNGNTTESEVLTFITRALNVPSVALINDADFTKRQSNTLLNFNNSLWLIAGFDGTLKNDVWNSSNGLFWSQINSNGSIFTARNRHTSVVFDNKMWVIAGDGGGTGKTNDVWNSSDGITWTQVNSNAGFSPRDRHTSVVFNNKIWVIGGSDNSLNKKNDVWSSSDGITWTEVTSSAPFSKRSSHTSVVFNNKIWVIGGKDATSSKNDVWSSSDGINWIEESISGTLFTARSEHTSVVYDDKIWVVGGTDFRRGIWSTKDGKNWIKNPILINSRKFHSSTIYNDKIWMIAGLERNSNGSFLRNDVWIFD